jgi:DNA-binding response OmpR family regulator
MLSDPLTMRVLLLEDEPAIRSALSRAISRWGCTVCPAGTLAEARSVVAGDPVDALVSDLKLPDGSGLDLAGELGVPFVLMSGYAVFTDAVAALRLGCVDFLTKPVALDTMRAAVESLRVASTADGWQLIEPLDSRGCGRLGRATLRSGVLERDELATYVWTWADIDEARASFAAVAAACATTLAERQLLAELAQAAPTGGRVVVNATSEWWRAWLDAKPVWEVDRRALVAVLSERMQSRPEGVLVECRTRGSGQFLGLTDVAAASADAWAGEVLWPLSLPGEGVLDLSQVRSLGSWVYPWLREQPRLAVVGASAQIRRQMRLVGLEALHYAHVEELVSARGVTPSERSLLWEDET